MKKNKIRVKKYLLIDNQLLQLSLEREEKKKKKKKKKKCWEKFRMLMIRFIAPTSTRETFLAGKPTTSTKAAKKNVKFSRLRNTSRGGLPRLIRFVQKTSIE
jgi:hypothetical protein